MSKENPNYYAIIPANVRYDTEINANEKLLYGEITALTQSTGVCWASNSYFSKLYDVTPQAISKWIKNLEKNNYIRISYKYKKGTKMIERRSITLVSIDVSKVSTTVEGGINHSFKGYQHTIKENTTSINTTSINNNPIVPLENETLFNEFWKEYPKKQDKKRSKRLYKKIDEETHKIIMKDLPKRKRTKDWLKDEGKYIPMPSTYLNNERWNDELDGVQEDEFRRVQTI